MKYYLIYILCFLGITFTSCRKPAQVSKSVNPVRSAKGQVSEYNFTEGMKSYILGRHSEALTYFQKAQSSPESASVNYMMAQASLGLSKVADALDYAQRAVKQDGKNKYYYLLLAQIYESQNNYAEAIKTYKKLIAEIPNNEEYYYELASAYIHSHNYDEALRCYSKIEEAYGKSPEVTRQKQQILVKLNKLSQAVEEGEALINAFPEEVEYKIVQAELLYSNNKVSEAEKILEDVVKHNPHETQARLELFDIYKTQGKEDKYLEQLDYIFNSHETDLPTRFLAIEELMKSPTEKGLKYSMKYAELTTQHHSQDPKAFVLAGDVYLKADKKEQAWEKYLKAKQLGVSEYNFWSRLIILDSELNKIDSMLLHADQALELFPNQAMLYLFKGSALQMKKQDDKAVEALEEGKKLSSKNPDIKNEFNVRLGDAYNSIKDYKKSDEAYEKALEYNKENYHVLNNYSYFLSLRKEKLELAKEMSEKLVKAHPAESTYLDTYAWVLYVMKNYEEAKKYLEIAAANSNNGTIVEHYGDALFQLGEKDKALQQWKKAKALGEASDLIDKKIKDHKLYE